MAAAAAMGVWAWQGLRRLSSAATSAAGGILDVAGASATASGLAVVPETDEHGGEEAVAKVGERADVEAGDVDEDARLGSRAEDQGHAVAAATPRPLAAAGGAAATLLPVSIVTPAALSSPYPPPQAVGLPPAGAPSATLREQRVSILGFP